jgi:hypothetical protein
MDDAALRVQRDMFQLVVQAQCCYWQDCQLILELDVTAVLDRSAAAARRDNVIASQL